MLYCYIVKRYAKTIVFMVSREELLGLLKDMESDRVERTTSFREEKLGQAVCAFSNDLPNHKKPGYVLLGVEDSGNIAGKKVGDEELQKLGDVRSNGNVLPQPHFEVSPVFHFPEGDVVVLEVHPSEFPPVRYKGRCYIRIGPRKGVASIQEERVLAEKRASTARTFDERSCPGSSIENLSLDLFQLYYLPQAFDAETLEANRRTAKEQLASLGFYDPVRGMCTNAGVLMFGNNPLYFIKGAYLQYVKFGGTEMTDTVREEKEFSGPLATVLKNLDDFVKTNIIKQKPVRQNGGFQERKVFNYPVWALRELLMNAVMHRDYESNAPVYIYEFTDRIEMVNPGGLYGDVRPENFPDASDYRNPIVAAGMKVLGYVNRFNFGVKNAQKQLEQNGNPPAAFNLGLNTKFAVTVRANGEWDGA